MDAEPLKDLMAIEGFIIDSKQKELLRGLVQLHKSISSSNIVLSSGTERSKIVTACDALEAIWKSQCHSIQEEALQETRVAQ